MSQYREVTSYYPPTQPVMKPFPLTSQTQNPPFGPGNNNAVQRVSLQAAQKFQVYQNSYPCQKVTVVNEGPGDLVYGYGGVNLASPVAASTVQPAGNAFEIASGAGKVIETSDAMNVWIGSVAGTVVSIEVTGLPGPPPSRILT